MRTALTIAGSDSGGGAGIQADLKTFAAHGVFGTSAITAVTAQNTLGVVAWQALPADLVTAQIEAVAGDIGADAVKIGMLATAAIVEAVAAAIEAIESSARRRRSGDDRERGGPAARRGRRRRHAGRAAPARPDRHAERAGSGSAGGHARALPRRHAAKPGGGSCELGPRVVLVKGGHLDGPDSIDVVCTADGTFEIRRPRIDTRHTHGTGCTLSSAIAANLALGLDGPRRHRARAGLSRRRDPPRAGPRRAATAR